MIVVTGEITVRPEDVERVRPHAIRMMEETAKEAGCIFYRFYEDLGRPGHIRVYEEWESLEALKAHGAAPHMAVWRGELARIGLLSRRIFLLAGAEMREI